MSLSYRTMFRTAAMLCCCLLPAVSQGAYISTITGPLNAGWSLGTPSITTNGENTVYTLAKETGNSIALALSVTKLHTPFVLSFNTIKETAPSASGWSGKSRIYDVFLTITNNLTGAHAATQYFNGFDFVSTSLFAGAPTFVDATDVDSGIFAFEQPFAGAGNLTGVNPDDSLRFGGLNGGGVSLAFGASTVVNFKVQVSQVGATAGTGASTFTLTANPEPTTLLLGSLVMVPAGVALRRRRKAAAAEAVA